MVWELLVSLLPIAAVAVFFKSCIFIVQQKSAVVIERFGRFQSVRSAGLNFKLPWPIDVVESQVSLKIEQLQSHVTVKTRDNVFVKVPVAVQFRVDDDADQVRRAVYELGNPSEQLTNYILTTLRAKINEMALQELYSDKVEIAEAVLGALTENFAKFGYNIETVLVDEPEVSEEVARAFNRVIASEREKEAAKNEGEARKTLSVKDAEAKAESMRLNGKGISDQRDAITDGFSASFKQLRESMPTLSEQEIAQHLVAIYTMETIKDAAANESTVVLMPYGGMGDAAANAALTAQMVGKV